MNIPSVPMPSRKDPGVDPVDLDPQTFPRADSAFKLRRMRDRIFGSELFGEPSWDVLLLLANVRDAERIPTVARVALDIHVPREVALRTVRALVQAGLVTIDTVATDDFSAKVRLTEAGCTKLRAVLG